MEAFKEEKYDYENTYALGRPTSVYEVVRGHHSAVKVDEVRRISST